MNQQATTAGTQEPTQDFYGQPQEQPKEAPAQQQQTISSYDVSISEKTKTEINDNMFSSVDFGPLKQFLDDDNITDISYSNNGQVWLKSLDKGVYRIDNPGINNELMEKISQGYSKKDILASVCKTMINNYLANTLKDKKLR